MLLICLTEIEQVCTIAVEQYLIRPISPRSKGAAVSGAISQSTVFEGDAERLSHPARAVRRPLPRRARRLDDRRRASFDSHRPAHVDELAAVGRERLRAR